MEAGQGSCKRISTGGLTKDPARKPRPLAVRSSEMRFSISCPSKQTVLQRTFVPKMAREKSMAILEKSRNFQILSNCYLKTNHFPSSEFLVDSEWIADVC